MTETWRVKRYYRPRVLISQDAVLDPTENEILLCLDGSELAVIRSLLAYAHRRITWVAEYRQADYVTPTAEDFDAIQAIVANLEDKLMTGLCEQIVTALLAIDGSIQVNGVALDTMAQKLTDIAGDVPDMVTALECICAKSEQTLINVTVAPDWIDYPGATDYFAWGDEEPDTAQGPLVDEEACQLAQAWYQAGFEYMTEVILPVIRFGFDKVIPAAAAAFALWTGGVGIPVAIGVYALAELIQELLELAYDAAETNLENWLFAHKQDIVCPLYLGLKDGGTGKGLWAGVQSSLIEPAGDLSAGDKFLINFAYSIVALAGAKVAKEQNSAWYQSVPVPGYCLVCEVPPIIGSDWVAIELPESIGKFDITHSAVSGWEETCYNFDLPDRKIVGMMTDLIYFDGIGDVEMHSLGGCPGQFSFTGDISEPKIQEHFNILCLDYAELDENDCKAELEPTATMTDQFTPGQDTDGGGTWAFWATEEEQIIFSVKYLIFQGAYWP